jgi:hypothetical protein
MRSPESFRSELEQLDAAIAAWGPFDALVEYPAAQLAVEGLLERRADLISGLADSEISAVTVVLNAPQLVGRGDIDVSFLVDFLSPLQSAVFSVGQALDSEVTTRGVIPATIQDASAMRLVGTFPGSFGLALEGPRATELSLLAMLDDPDEADRPTFERAVENVFDVLEQVEPSEEGHTDEDVLGALATVGARAHGHLRRLASAIASRNANAQLQLTVPDHETRTVTFSRPAAERLERVLTTVEASEREVQMRGRLVGASLVRDNFELELEDGTVIRGKVADEVLPILREFFSESCTATLRVSTVRSTVDGTVAERHTLIGVR